MKKTLLIVGLVVILSTVVNAQKVEKSKTIEVSASLLYGQFTDDYTKGVYESSSGFDFSVILESKYKWISLGAFIKSQKFDEGTPYSSGAEVYGISDMSLFSWGPAVYINGSKNFRIFTSLGFLKVTENLYSSIGDVSGSVKGTELNFGARANFPIGKTFSLFGQGVYSIRMLNGSTIEGKLNSWNVGGGIALRF